MSELPPTGRTPQVGSRFGHYVIERQLGVGGMGAVFLASDVRLHRRVALKVLLGNHAQSPQWLQRFQREAAVLARLDSPHVITVFEHGQLEGWPYIATQYAAGGDLGRLIRERGPLPPALAARACSQVADALVAAHSVGVIHRDVKPANVLIRDARLDRLDRLHVYLGDFGVAHTESTGLTTAGAVAGTWSYLAPERAEGTPGTPATDIYSVGCLLWETLTGTPPYAGSDVEVAMAHLHDPVPQLPEVDAFTIRANPVLARAMAKDPAHRQGSALELREEIRALAPQSAAPSFSGLAAVRRRRSRRLRLAAVCAALVLVGGGAAAAALVLPDGSEDPKEPAPTADPDPSLTPPPPAEEAVTGDLDGDRLGDLAYLDQDRDVLRVFPSTGTGFGGPTRRSVSDGETVLGDVTGDGRLDVLDVRGSGEVLGVSVAGAGGETVSPVRAPAGSTEQELLVGDFDGDGHDDLAVAGYGSGRIEIMVAAGSESGALGGSRRWFEGRDGDSVALAVGDLDADERDDIALLAFQGGAPRLRLLASSGTAFESAGAGTELRGADSNSGYLRVADLEGDGSPEVVLVPTYAYDEDVLVLRYAAGFEPVPGWRIGRNDGVDSVAVSDVDGDGRDDLVLVPSGAGRASAWVSRSDGQGFAPLATWLRDQPLGDYGHAVDRLSESYWGGYA